LARLIAAFADPEVALSAPVFAGQPAEAGAGRAPSFTRKVARAIGLTNRYAAVPRTRGADQWDVDFAIGACQLIRRDAYDVVGGLDESIFYGPEDVDLCLRLRANGWRVVQVDAVCEHPARRRNRRLLTRRGLAHAGAVVRHLRRHRGFVSVGVSAERSAR
jgi:GT2 family glycosyltransferase